MSVQSPAYIVLQLTGGTDPDDIAAGQTFWSSDEAEAECERLQAEAPAGVRFYVKETFFFSGSVRLPHQ